MRGFEFQNGSGIFLQGWLRVFGYGLAWEWDQPARFSDRMGIRKSLVIGKLRIRTLTPRGSMPEIAAQEIDNGPRCQSCGHPEIYHGDFGCIASKCMCGRVQK